MYEFRGKALVKFRKFIKRNFSKLDDAMVLRISRDEAHKERKKIIQKNGRSVIDRKLNKRIKKYCRDRFGSSSYWPWLAVYTEIRGEFLEGWIPDDFYRFKILGKLNPNALAQISNYKSVDYTIFEELIVKPLFLRIGNQFLNAKGRLLEQKDIKKILKDFDDEIVIKPDEGLGGKGIIFCQSNNINLDQLPKDVDLVFQPSVKQHISLNKINPHSVNTFRVFTYLNKEGIIELMLVKLRFGRGESRVDNTSLGGGFNPVHIEGHFHKHAFDSNNNIIGSKHPDTSIKISEINLSLFYDKIVNICKEAHSKFPHVGIIGWDVCVQEDGSPLLLEWNANNPGFWNYEAVFGPIWPTKNLSFYSI